MKKFIVKETRPAMATWTYEVEAESESEAVAKVFDEGDTNKAPDLTYDVDFEADMEVEVDEEVPASTSDNIIVASFTKDALIEYTRTIQERALAAAKEAVKGSGVDIESYIELDLYGREINIEIDEDNIYSEINSSIEDAFETDDDSVWDEATNVIMFMSKR